MPGAAISEPEITHISAHGVWLLTGEGELFLPYEAFPWFRNARIDDVLRVEEPSPGHYYWPSLDVDLTRDIILHPEKYPLRSRL